MNIAQLKHRAAVSESCLPDAPYRDMLRQLHLDMFASMRLLQDERDAALMDAKRWREYQVRKQAVVNAGMAKNAMRTEAISSLPPYQPGIKRRSTV
jgi:hypothetical protein